MPNSLAILGATFSGEARGRAIGIWASIGAVMGAVGPVLGGWLIDTVGWRSIFVINLPFAIGAIVLAIIYIRPRRAPRARGPAIGPARGLIGDGRPRGHNLGAGRIWTYWDALDFRHGAEKRTRTSTVLPPPGPEPGASTNSAISARRAQNLMAKCSTCQ
jgi:MFS family permease